MIGQADDDKLPALGKHLGVESELAQVNAPSFWQAQEPRVFISHVSSFKKEATDFKASMRLFGISGFVAHEYGLKGFQLELTIISIKRSLKVQSFQACGYFAQGGKLVEKAGRFRFGAVHDLVQTQKIAYGEAALPPSGPVAGEASLLKQREYLVIDRLYERVESGLAGNFREIPDMYSCICVFTVRDPYLYDALFQRSELQRVLRIHAFPEKIYAIARRVGKVIARTAEIVQPDEQIEEFVKGIGLFADSHQERLFLADGFYFHPSGFYGYHFEGEIHDGPCVFVDVFSMPVSMKLAQGAFSSSFAKLRRTGRKRHTPAHPL